MLDFYQAVPGASEGSSTADVPADCQAYVSTAPLALEEGQFMDQLYYNDAMLILWSRLLQYPGERWLLVLLARPGVLHWRPRLWLDRYVHIVSTA